MMRRKDGWSRTERCRKDISTYERNKIARVKAWRTDVKISWMR